MPGWRIGFSIVTIIFRHRGLPVFLVFVLIRWSHPCNVSCRRTSNTNRRRRNVCDQSFKICHQKIVPVTPGAALQRQKPNSPQNHKIEISKTQSYKIRYLTGGGRYPNSQEKKSVVFLLSRIHFEHGTPGPFAQFFSFLLAFPRMSLATLSYYFYLL